MLELTNEYRAFYSVESSKRSWGYEEEGQAPKPGVLLVKGTAGSRYVSRGLVGTVIEAYNNHHNLQLRPDDIWIAILTQFCSYVNGRAEKLRSKFVCHEGKKTLEVSGFGTIYTIDFGQLTK